MRHDAGSRARSADRLSPPRGEGSLRHAWVFSNEIDNTRRAPGGLRRRRHASRWKAGRYGLFTPSLIAVRIFAGPPPSTRPSSREAGEGARAEGALYPARRYSSSRRSGRIAADRRSLRRALVIRPSPSHGSPQGENLRRVAGLMTRPRSSRGTSRRFASTGLPRIGGCSGAHPRIGAHPRRSDVVFEVIPPRHKNRFLLRQRGTGGGSSLPPGTRVSTSTATMGLRLHGPRRGRGRSPGSTSPEPGTGARNAS